MSVEKWQILESLTGTVLECCDISHERQWIPGFIDVLGKETRVDYLVHPIGRFMFGLYIECKWQSSAGSTEQKTIALMHNIKEVYDKPTIVICEGSESQKSRELLSRNTGGNLYGSMTLADFIDFCHGIQQPNASMTFRKRFDANQAKLFTL